jgi:hypothetical protein
MMTMSSDLSNMIDWLGNPPESLTVEQSMALSAPSSVGLRLQYMRKQGMVPFPGDEFGPYVDTTDASGRKVSDPSLSSKDDEGLFGSGLGMSELLMLLMFIPSIAGTYYTYKNYQESKADTEGVGPNTIRIG